MSLSYRSNKVKLALPVLALCLLTQAAAFAQSDQTNYSGGTPVKPGAITLDQVIETHQGLPEATIQQPLTPPQPAAQPAPTLTTPQLRSSVGDMLMQGMASDLQEPQAQQAQQPQLAAPKLKSPQLLNAIPAPSPTPPTIASPSLNAATPTLPAAAAPATGAPQALPMLAAPAQIQATPGCTPHVETWVRKCSDAGYPDEFVGQIKGETRTTCPAGALQDVWLSNSCAPAEEGAAPAAAVVQPIPSAAPAPAQAAQAPAPATGFAQAPSVIQPKSTIISTSTLVDAVCGSANGLAANITPSNDLCARGMASRVNGNGPWTWACSGIDGGLPAACSAPRANGVISSKRDAICGMASSIKHKDAPKDELCSVGEPSGVSGNGPWLWTCDGIDGGASVSCSADLSAETPPAEEQPIAAAAVLPAETSGTTAATTAPAEAAASAETAAATPETSIISASDTFVRHETSICGTAAELAAFEAPTRDLCRIGQASAIAGNGPWTWTCSDQTGRITNCSTLAPGSFKTATLPAPEEGATAAAAAAAAASAATATTVTTAKAKSMCGAADGQGVEEKPTDELCAAGKASVVKGKGPWTWTCTKGKKKTACTAPKLIDGICGKANGSVRKGAPTTDLCKAGTATPIQGEGPWLWSCVGSGGGISVSCSSTTQSQTRLDGACGAASTTTMISQPTSSLCDSGVASNVSGAGPWTWTCSGSNGGNPATCTTQKTGAAILPAPPSGPPVNGLCGTSNGAAVFSTPTAGLCDAGTPSLAHGTGPWTWTCSGNNGGITVSCTAVSMASSLTTSHLSPQPADETAPPVPTNSNFPVPPTPSQVPATARVNAGETAAGAVPALPQEAQALTPPPVSATLVPTPGLKPNGVGRDVAPLANTSFTLDEEFSTIPFGRGEENIDPAELPTLDKLADVLVNNGSVRITLTAYADATNTSPREARRLSLTRALAVRDYLTAKGVSSSRIDVRALGANVPSGDADRIDVKAE